MWPVNTEKTPKLLHMTNQDWEIALTQANPTDLLPQRVGAIPYSIQAPLTLIDSLPIASDSRICIVVDSSGKYFSLPLLLRNGRVKRAEPGEGLAQAISDFPIGIHYLGNFTLSVKNQKNVSGERSMGVDQTEESIVVGEEIVVKYFSQVTDSTFTSLPKIEALDNAHLPFIPKSFLNLEWRDSGSHFLLAQASAYIPGAVDGWTWAIQDVQEFLDGHQTLDQAAQCGVVLGEILAGMHLAFTACSSSIATDFDVAQWVELSLRDLDLAGSDHNETINLYRSKIESILASAHLDSPQRLSFTHGDLHVGQFLRTPEGKYFVIDFDGNPVADPSEAPNRQPLLQDLSSLIQSIDHVARVVDKRRNYSRAQDLQKWITSTQRLLMSTYKGLCDQDVDSQLMKIFQIQQECREFIYAQKHLPVWRYVPEAAMAALMKENE